MIKSQPDLKTLQSLLQINFNNPQLLLTAITHKSYTNEDKTATDNERLEFLGDAVLEFVVSDFLYKNFQNQPEGNLTALRAKIVCTTSLTQLAKHLNLGKFLRLSKGEAKSGGRQNINILADLVEAIIGAIYLDQGLTTAYNFIHRHLLSPYHKLPDLNQIKSAKTRLQEIIQNQYKLTPIYKVIQEKPDQDAPDHFTIGVYVNNQLLGVGQGKNKKTAQEKAAQAALQKLKH